MMANFSGDVLFSSDMTALTKMLGGMKAKQRNAVIDFILDLFRYLKEKLSGNEKITLEIVKLERMFNEAVYDAAQSLKSESQTSQNQKTTTEISGDGDYSSAPENLELLELVNKVENKQFNPKEKIKVGTISQEQAEIIKELTGADVSGYDVIIEARQIEDIIKDHGKNGKSDRSISNNSDIAKLPFILKDNLNITNSGRTQAYVSNVDGRNKSADTVIYEKALGEKSYYAVEAIPNTKKSCLYSICFYWKTGI